MIYLLVILGYLFLLLGTISGIFLGGVKFSIIELGRYPWLRNLEGKQVYFAFYTCLFLVMGFFAIAAKEMIIVSDASGASSEKSMGREYRIIAASCREKGLKNLTLGFIKKASENFKCVESNLKKAEKLGDNIAVYSLAVLYGDTRVMPLLDNMKPEGSTSSLTLARRYWCLAKRNNLPYARAPHPFGLEVNCKSD